MFWNQIEISFRLGQFSLYICPLETSDFAVNRENVNLTFILNSNADVTSELIHTLKKSSLISRLDWQVLPYFVVKLLNFFTIENKIHLLLPLEHLANLEKVDII